MERDAGRWLEKRFSHRVKICPSVFGEGNEDPCLRVTRLTSSWDDTAEEWSSVWGASFHCLADARGDGWEEAPHAETPLRWCKHDGTHPAPGPAATSHSLSSEKSMTSSVLTKHLPSPCIYLSLPRTGSVKIPKSFLNHRSMISSKRLEKIQRAHKMNTGKEKTFKPIISLLFLHCNYSTLCMFCLALISAI